MIGFIGAAVEATFDAIRGAMFKRFSVTVRPNQNFLLPQRHPAAVRVSLFHRPEAPEGQSRVGFPQHSLEEIHR
jgi:hypothetical protein